MNDSIQPTKITSSRKTSIGRSLRRRSGLVRTLLAAPTLLFLFLATATAFAGSATWLLNPPNNVWDSCDPENWMPATVPNGPNDTATFGVSNKTDIVVDNDFEVEVNGIVFNAGASRFTFTVVSFSSFNDTLKLSGAGITNDSGITQNFVTEEVDGASNTGLILFTNSATAGDLTVFTNAGQNGFGTASSTTFQDTSTAANATLIANAGSTVGGAILFEGDSTGGTARVEVFGNGSLDLSSHNAPGVTVGSIEGDGLVLLGANNLSVGSNNLNITFSGVIRGGGLSGGTRGSLTKIGQGRLTLSGAITYTGGTTINGGTLLTNNQRHSGIGDVQVNAGTLGGAGVAGAVTVGTGNGPGAFLSPGANAVSHRTLSIRSALTFNSDGTYKCGFSSSTAQADKVITNGATINSGARFRFEDSQSSVLPLGTVFTAISNTSVNPINGTFFNLADGSTFTVGLNTYQVSYEGGDGNDLTLTVVPQP